MTECDAEASVEPDNRFWLNLASERYKLESEARTLRLAEVIPA